ncbi:hypothetical protein ABT300_38225, partial [Streptomyces sp. NPDC001027]
MTGMTPLPTLSAAEIGTDRLRLRRAHDADIDGLVELLTDPQVRAHLGPVVWITPQTPGAARASAALSSVADAPHRRPPPPCSCTHHTPLT